MRLDAPEVANAFVPKGSPQVPRGSPRQPAEHEALAARLTRLRAHQQHGSGVHEACTSHPFRELDSRGMPGCHE